MGHVRSKSMSTVQILKKIFSPVLLKIGHNVCHEDASNELEIGLPYKHFFAVTLFLFICGQVQHRRIKIRKDLTQISMLFCHYCYYFIDPAQT